MGSWKWRRPQRNDDVLDAACVAIMRQMENDGMIDEFLAAMDAQGFGDMAREQYANDKLRRAGVRGCLECGEDPNIPCSTCGTDRLPPAGWYEDPEDDGYLRWFNGEEWIGGPVAPEHALKTSDFDVQTDDGGYHRWTAA